MNIYYKSSIYWIGYLIIRFNTSNKPNRQFDIIEKVKISTSLDQMK